MLQFLRRFHLHAPFKGFSFFTVKFSTVQLVIIAETKDFCKKTHNKDLIFLHGSSILYKSADAVTDLCFQLFPASHTDSFKNLLYFLFLPALISILHRIDLCNIDRTRISINHTIGNCTSGTLPGQTDVQQIVTYVSNPCSYRCFTYMLRQTAELIHKICKLRNLFLRFKLCDHKNIPQIHQNP